MEFSYNINPILNCFVQCTILDYMPIPLCSSGLIDQIFFVCAKLTNFLPPLVSDEKESSSITMWLCTFDDSFCLCSQTYFKQAPQGMSRRLLFCK